MSSNFKPLYWALGVLIYLIAVSVPWKTKEVSLPALAPFFSPSQGFWQNAESVRTFSSMEVTLDVAQEVNIIYDRAGIPHIFANSIEDAFYALGYLHAKDRLFQMDFTHRAAAGKISELIGTIAMDYDMEMRKKGMGLMIEKMVQKWEEDPEINDLLSTYIGGVNASVSGLSKSQFPIEYKLLNQSPELWNKEKTAAILGYLNHNLTFRHDDIAASRTRDKIGDELYPSLFPNWHRNTPPVIPDEWLFKAEIYSQEHIGFDRNILPATPLIQEAETNWSFFEMPPEYNGSNNWAVAPSKTTDGSTFISNDPHLPLTLPSIWYECHIITPEVNLYGFSIPGVPGIFLGMSEHIAIATTNVGCDYVDWFKIHWSDEERRDYRIDEEQLALTFREETIRSSDGKFLTKNIPYSAFGPLPYYYEEDHPLRDFAMHWRAIEPEGNLLRSLISILNAQNFEDFLAASDYLSDPPQNLVYGDRLGNIGLRITGSLPHRAHEYDGVFLKDGRKRDSLFNQSIPTNELPLSFNPEAGFVASANQISTGEAYPYPNVGIYEKSRGTYLFNQLYEKESIDLAFLKNLITDNRSQKAGEMLEVLLPLLDLSLLDQEETQLHRKLQNWDHYFEANSDEAVLFKIWERKLLSTAWDEFQTFNTEQPEDKKLRPNWKTTIELLISEPKLDFWNMVNTNEKETAEMVALESFKMAVAKYQNWKEEHPEGSWAQFRDSSIPHLARIEPFSHTFIQSGGTGSALNAIKSSHGPSMRMIAQFRGEERFFYSALPGGTSGNPGSLFYADRIEQWEKGEFHQAYIGREKEPVMETASRKILIAPSRE